jgi:threonine dehydratase
MQVLRCDTLDKAGGMSLLLKAECFQVTGSFKVRGALNALGRRSANIRSGGVLTHR